MNSVILSEPAFSSREHGCAARAIRAVPRLAAAHVIIGMVMAGSLLAYAHTTARYGHTFMMVDGYLYYTHARSWYFDGDCDYANDMRMAPGFDAHATYTDQLSPNGRATNLHPCAWSIVALPFLAVADGLTIAHNAALGASLPRTGYSAYYLAIVPLSHVFVGLLGLLLSYSVLRRYFADTIAALAAALVWWGTHVCYFVGVEPTQSHALSMTAVTATIWASDTIRRGGWTWQRAIGLGVGCGLMVAIRYVNVTWVIVPAVLLGPALLRGFKGGSAPSVGRLRHLALAIGVASVCLLPQLLVNLVNEGTPLGRLARYLPARWLSPQFSVELFDAPTGLLRLYPLVVVCLAGLFLLLRRQPREPLVVALTLAFAVHVVVQACSYGENAGYPRRYVCCFLLFSLGLANVLQWSCGHRMCRTAVALVIGGAVLHNLALMAMVDRGVVARAFINRGRLDLTGVVARDRSPAIPSRKARAGFDDRQRSPQPERPVMPALNARAG